MLAAAAASAFVFGLVSPASGQLEQPVVVSDNPADWTPHVIDGRVNALVQIGDTMVAGGTFTQVSDADNGRTLNQSYLFAFDAETGQIDTRFDPRLDGAVEALAVAPDGDVIVGGAFTSVDNAKQDRLAKIDLQQVRVDNSFKGSANDLVQDLAVVGDDLYVAGRFTQVAGADRSGMARLDAGNRRGGRRLQRSVHRRTALRDGSPPVQHRPRRVQARRRR